MLHYLSLLWSSAVKQTTHLWAQTESHRENYRTLNWEGLEGSSHTLLGSFIEQCTPGPILELLYQITEAGAQLWVFF